MSEAPQEGRTAAEQREQYLVALREERAGYVRTNKPDRVRAVDEQIRRLTEGAKPAKKATR